MHAAEIEDAARYVARCNNFPSNLLGCKGPYDGQCDHLGYFAGAGNFAFEVLHCELLEKFTLKRCRYVNAFDIHQAADSIEKDRALQLVELL